MHTFVILINSLSCLSPSHRWIVVNKISKTSLASQDKGKENANKLYTSIPGLTRVALKLDDIKKEYQGYVEEKQQAVARNLSFIGF